MEKKDSQVEFRHRVPSESTIGRIYQYLETEPFSQSRKDEVERALKAFWLPYTIYQEGSEGTFEHQEVALNCALVLETQATLIRQRFKLGSSTVVGTAANGVEAKAPTGFDGNSSNGNGNHQKPPIPVLELGGEDYLFDNDED